jgi:hypothetical protein
MSLTIWAGSGSGQRLLEEAGVVVLADGRSRTGVSKGRVAWPVRFIINTGFVAFGGAAVCMAPRPAAALPDTGANGGGMAGPTVELVTTDP